MKIKHMLLESAGHSEDEKFIMENFLVESMLLMSNKKITRPSISEELGIREVSTTSQDTLPLDAIKARIKTNPILVVHTLRKNGHIQEAQKVMDTYQHLEAVINEAAELVKDEIIAEVDTAYETFTNITK